MFKQIVKIIISLYFLATASLSIAQSDTMQVRLAGVIYMNDSTSNSPFIHVINLRTGAGVISDSLGFFKIKIQKRDSLLFRCIGYDDKVFKLEDSMPLTTVFVKIKMSETTYTLKVIDVYALNRLSQFRYDFLKIPLPDDEIKYQIYIPGISQKKYKWMLPKPSLIPTANGGSIISLLYYMWSKNGQSMMKYIKLLEEEDGNRKIDEKYNMKLLSEFTGFTGDTLIDFKVYLNYNRQYLLKTNKYDIFLDVQNRLPGFKLKQINNLRGKP